MNCPPEPLKAPETTDAEHLAALIRGHIVTQLISSAVRFGIPDLLGDGSTLGTELSAATGIGMPELRRYLRALQGFGLVEAVDDERYRGTRLIRYLRRDTGGLYGQALMAGQEYYDAWAELDFALRTGGSAFERRHGCGLWEWFAENDETAAAFTRTMRWNTERALDEILELHSFPVSGVIADLGAGDGVLTVGLLARLPGLRAIVFEQPAVLANTRRSVEDHGFGDRCQFLPGDFRAEVPAGADIYLLKSVIHNWDDATALRILRNCHEAMGGRGQLLLIERAMNTDDMPDAAIRDMVMLVLFGSRDRTAEEYAALLRDAGFTFRGARSGATGLCVLEAVPT